MNGGKWSQSLIRQEQKVKRCEHPSANTRTCKHGLHVFLLIIFVFPLNDVEVWQEEYYVNIRRNSSGAVSELHI